ncbi:MAG: glycosyltransferase, partial [Fidelibacterota bacterium]
MLTGQDILCISSIDWDFIWQGHQEIMASLAEQGNRVLFVENTGVRSPRFKDLPRLRRRILNWWRGTKGFRQERENLFVYSPLVLPFPYSRVARWINRIILLRAIRRWMRATGFYRPIIWTFLPTPLTSILIRELDPELTVYYCIDDLASSSPPARRISRSEVQFFKEVDLVFVTSEKLRERAAEFSGRVHLFPFGVNYREFEEIRKASDEIPEEIRKLPHPVVGYVGGVHQWIDQELLATVAERMSDTSFVLVGPAQTDVSLLARSSNIHLLGARSHADVSRYIKGFDVGIVPYCLSEYTDSVYPTKLNEYLAMGIPVVATDLPEIRRFNAEHMDVLAVAKDAHAFGAAIRDAIVQTSP